MNNESERAAFEEWAKKKNMDLTPFDETFDSDFTSSAWDGWQARAASANETGAEGANDFCREDCTCSREFGYRVCGKAPAVAAEAAAIPTGYALVPVEPTTAMLAEIELIEGFTHRALTARYSAMLAAAPRPSAQADAREGLTDEQRAVIATLLESDVLSTDEDAVLREILQGTNHVE